MKILRGIGGVIVGILTMAIGTGLFFAAAYALLGTERSFKPDVFQVTNTWIAVMIVAIVIFGALAGWLCRKISGGRAAVWVFALAYGALALANNWFVVRVRPIGPREGPISGMEAANAAVEPMSWLLLSPLAIVVLIAWGGGLLKQDVEA